MLFAVLTSSPNGAARGDDARYTMRQTQRQHDDALDIRTTDAYRLAMELGIATPAGQAKLAEAYDEAAAREAALPQYWNDRVPRKNINIHSSWVPEIDYTPNSYGTSGIMMIPKFGKTYIATPQEVSDILNGRGGRTAGSIGSALNAFWKRYYGG